MYAYDYSKLSQIIQNYPKLSLIAWYDHVRSVTPVSQIYCILLLTNPWAAAMNHGIPIHCLIVQVSMDSFTSPNPVHLLQMLHANTCKPLQTPTHTYPYRPPTAQQRICLNFLATFGRRPPFSGSPIASSTDFGSSSRLFSSALNCASSTSSRNQSAAHSWRTAQKPLVTFVWAIYNLYFDSLFSRVSEFVNKNLSVYEFQNELYSELELLIIKITIY